MAGLENSLELRAADGTFSDLLVTFILNGTEEADILNGGAGDDLIRADGGNDVVSGGLGANTVELGAGDDSYTGGRQRQ